MPEGAVYVGRPTRWGNPYEFSRRVGPATRAAAVEGFRRYAARAIAMNPGWLDPLRGHDLACWCPLDQTCHADVLLELLA